MTLVNTTQIKDFSYYDQGFFTLFMPNTKEAEVAYAEMLSVLGGVSKVPTIQAKQTIAQLKKAGYTVGKGKKLATSIDDILLDELFA